jgi:hypothetical protein
MQNDINDEDIVISENKVNNFTAPDNCLDLKFIHQPG